MRDFSALPKCVRGSHTESESRAEDGKHRALCLRPTRRPLIASAPCLKSLPQCHLPSCSHMQPGPNSSVVRQEGQGAAGRLQSCVLCVHGNMRFTLHWQQSGFSQPWLISILYLSRFQPLLHETVVFYWQQSHLTVMFCGDPGPS